MTGKSAWVRHTRVAQLEEGTISITVYMPDNYVQTLMLTPGDYIDLLDAIEAFNTITGRRERN